MTATTSGWHQVGVTMDGLPVIDGADIWRTETTDGVPLYMIIECVYRRARISWPAYRTAAMTSGMKHARVLGRITEALADAGFRDHVEPVRVQLEALNG